MSITYEQYTKEMARYDSGVALTTSDIERMKELDQAAAQNGWNYTPQNDKITTESIYKDPSSSQPNNSSSSTSSSSSSSGRGGLASSDEFNSSDFDKKMENFEKANEGVDSGWSNPKHNTDNNDLNNSDPWYSGGGNNSGGGTAAGNGTSTNQAPASPNPETNNGTN